MDLAGCESAAGTIFVGVVSAAMTGGDLLAPDPT